MTTIKEDLTKQSETLHFIYDKVDEGCRLYSEDMQVEAEIAFSEAVQFSEALLENNPNDITNRLILAETHHILSLGFTQIMELDKASTHIHTALSIYDNMSDKDIWYELTLKSSLARIEHVSGHHEEAISILEKVAQCFDQYRVEEFKPDDYIYCSNMVLLAFEYFDCGSYEKAKELTERIIEFKHKQKDSTLNMRPQEYLDLLDSAASNAMEQDDLELQCHLLKEGIDTCKQAMAEGKNINLFSLCSFYQNIINLFFFKNDQETLKPYFMEMVRLCDENRDKDARFSLYKISTLLNYSVFCVKNGDYQEAEENVNIAIDECMNAEDDKGPENTIFLVSALQTMSNMRFQQGEVEEALRDLETACNLLKNYLDTHLELKPNLYSFLLELIHGQVILCQKIEQPERGEAILSAVLAEYQLSPEDYQHPEIAPYMVALKKVADTHWELGKKEQAKKEYQEVLFILGNVTDYCPDLSEAVQFIGDEIRQTLAVEASEVQDA